MVLNKNFQKLALIGFLVIATLSPVSSAGLELDTSEIWAHPESDKTVTGQWTCDTSSGSDHDIDIVSSESTKYTNVRMNSTDYTYRFDENSISEFGEYRVMLDCGDDNNYESEKVFDVNHFELERTAPSSQTTVYQGKNFGFSLEGKVNGKTVELTNENTEFRANLLDYGMLDTVQRGISNQGTNIDAEIPEDMSPGVKTLLTSVKYRKGGGILADPQNGPLRVKIEPTWQAEVLNKTPEDGMVSYQNLDDLSMDVRVTKKGKQYDKLSSDDFYLTVTEEGSNKTKVVKGLEKTDMVSASWRGSGKYRIRMSKIPQMGLGRYNFQIGLDNGDTAIENFTVSKYILFDGRITDAAGKAVNGKISVEKEGFTRQVNVENGEFSGNVLPGEYNFSLEFPDAGLSLKGVSLRESKNTVKQGRAIGTIRYDEMPVNKVSKSLEGVTVAKAVAMWFGYSFDEGRISISYDTAKVNPENLKVYQCVGWNINGVSCYSTSKWEPVNKSKVNVHPTVGKVTFPAKAYNNTGSPMLLNGYMVVKGTPLELSSFEMSSDRIVKGENIDVGGKIETGSGDSVGDANVEVEIVERNGKSTGRKTTLVTDGAGSFGGSIRTPSKEGNYRLKVKATKDIFSPLDTTISEGFSTYTERGLSLQAPDTTEFFVGAKSRSSYTIINSGQEPVSDIKISVRGFNNRWYNFSEPTRSNLAPGQSFKTTLTTRLPSDYCSGSCQEYKNIDIEVTGNSGGKVNDIASVQAQISKDQPTEKASNTEDNVDSGSSLSMPSTGQFLEEQSDFNMALGVIVLFMVMLAAAVKKKKNDENRDRRSSGRAAGGNGMGSGGGMGSSGGMRKAKPSVGSDGVIDVEASSSNEEDKDNSKDENSSKGLPEKAKKKCDVCGEEFDTEAALDVHSQTVHG